METIRCINRRENKVRNFVPYIALNPIKMARMGFEIEDPVYQQKKQPAVIAAPIISPILEEKKQELDEVIDEFAPKPLRKKPGPKPKQK